MPNSHLVQILLPVSDAAKRRFDPKLYNSVATELTERFGGLTAYSRAPATGLWESPDGSTSRDDVVVYEVMVSDLDRAWWSHYRVLLERMFEQDELVVRAHAIERL